jgi:YidC/Oxa1 family membrane protein insertase
VTGGLYRAPFYGWIHDLSAPDPYFILPIVSVLLLVGQQLLTPSTAKNTQQKVMMIAMPVIFGLMMLFLPSGLCLYMVISSTFSMVQSYYVRRLIAKEEDPVAASGDDGDAKTIDVEALSSKDKRAAKRREESKES